MLLVLLLLFPTTFTGALSFTFSFTSFTSAAAFLGEAGSFASGLFSSSFTSSFFFTGVLRKPFFMSLSSLASPSLLDSPETPSITSTLPLRKGKQGRSL